jgi:hypothetical protein
MKLYASRPLMYGLKNSIFLLTVFEDLSRNFAQHSHQKLHCSFYSQIRWTDGVPNKPLGRIARVTKIKTAATSAPEPVPITGSR